MKITFKTILDSVQPFRELQELKLPPRTSLDIYKAGKELDRELKVYSELQKKIYEDHEIPVATEGTGYDLQGLPGDKFKELIADLEELVSSEVEIKDYHIDPNTFERFQTPISASMLANLEWLISEVPAEEQVIDETGDEEPAEMAPAPVARKKNKRYAN